MDYTIQGGDNLSRIAKAHGTSVDKLLELNPELKSHPNSIMKGANLKLPDPPQDPSQIDMGVMGMNIEHQQEQVNTLQKQVADLQGQLQLYFMVSEEQQPLKQAKPQCLM